MKILYCASVPSHLKNFHLPYIQWLSEQGCEITTLTDDGQMLPYVFSAEKVPFTKNLLSPQNVKSIICLKELFLKHSFDLIITNTTLAGAVVRAAILLTNKRIRPFVIHICHGYLFDERGILRKLLYLPPEKICAAVTDLLVVMNKEDERIAQKYKLAERIEFVHGMGVDSERFKPNSGPERLSGFTFVCVADFTKRKNQPMLIRAFAKLADKLPDLTLAFAGDGATMERCRRLAEKLGVAKRVMFMGYVADIAGLLPRCDAAVSVSRYEGLPFNIMEAMLCELPIVASDIRGHCDLLENTEAMLFNGEDGLVKKLFETYNAERRRVKYPNIGRYTLANVMREWETIYTRQLQKVKAGL
ncbi:MAG: glycosyltransferase [Clostridiales bacterium]|nr:glycosyltransferase [Clostridiales bacterium]